MIASRRDLRDVTFSVALRLAVVALLAALGVAGGAALALSQSQDLASLLASTPADSLVAPLTRLESSAGPAEGAAAAFTLGQLHYARGEYRKAAVAFARAAARLDPTRKPEARYWLGLSWLGLGDAAQARAALEDVAARPTARRVDAGLALAQAWDLAQRPDRALESLTPLLEEDLGDAGPAVLERIGALSERFNRQDAARKARERLLRDYPRSIEAAAARLTLATAGKRPGAGGIAVVIGTFADRSRARSLAGEAKRGGFPEAEVVTRGEGLMALHIVRLGTYANAREARTAGEQATRALGVTYEIVRSK